MSAVIWCTGYRLDFGWVRVGVLDAAGAPMHDRGVTACPGLYFLGLSWLSKAKSSFLYGVGEDAEYIASRIALAPS
jgi:putative flavoprotein involved in K+ transport